MQPTDNTYHIWKTEECSIGLEKIKKPGILFPCGHMFELTAIQEWEEKSSECPIDQKEFKHICTSENEFIRLAKKEGGTVEIHEPDPSDDSSDDDNDIIPTTAGPKIKAQPLTAKNVLIERGFLSLILGVAVLAASIILGITMAFPPIIAIGAGVCAISIIAFLIINQRYTRANKSVI